VLVVARTVEVQAHLVDAPPRCLDSSKNSAGGAGAMVAELRDRRPVENLLLLIGLFGPAFGLE
jgi:hypothetical protein